MLNISRAGLLIFLCLFPIVAHCSHGGHGRPRRHRHHERRFYDDHHGHRRPHNHHGFHFHGKDHNLVAENHVLDNSANGNKVTEDPKKPGQPGFGSQWALTYQGMQQESSTINNTVSNVTAQLGGTAFLPCRVGHLGDRQISWIRRRDWHVLTSGAVLYTHDQRFSVLHAAGSQDWTLHIKYVSVKDNGTYECQVSTGTGIISLFVNLAVVTPEAHIPGHGQYHVNHGSPITLTCVIKQSPTPPQYVSWYHNGVLLNYLRDRPDVTISTQVRGPNMASSISKLEVANASDKHSGNYTCSADNTLPASTMVFVTEGDKTAAVQRIDSGSRGHLRSDHTYALLLLGTAASLWHLLADR
ncbi:limbic system-associated membrane protein-like [Macrobrachium rosenbergii]|uniref:limbic system-associated membrane protein-like n=1 Tax=Macrobrachium rosenbergii TaxID=79674 RepID=UPI0034D62C22